MDVPICLGCAYVKAHRKPTQRKVAKNKKQLRTVIAKGQVVSVYQISRPTPFFIPTLRGRPATQNYVGATVFIDHFSDFTYIHLMEKLDG